MPKYLLILFPTILALSVAGQIPAGLIGQADISADHIVFAYAEDLWVLSRDGGQASRLSTPPGPEFFPRFSPDGRTVVFTANYNGNLSLYTIPVTGGVPTRLTWHTLPEVALDWTPDGRAVLMASDRLSGSNRFSRLFTVPATGGLPTVLPMPYGEFGCFSPDGRKLAFTPRSRLMRTWKRYRGGMAADIYLYDLETDRSINITDDPANDELPMWWGETVYFLSDRDSLRRPNLWAFDVPSATVRQVTRFTDADVRYPSLGPDAIVFSSGDRLYTLSLPGEVLTQVPVHVVTDLAARMPRHTNAAPYVQSLSVAPDGHRVLFGARGEIFSVPAEEGAVLNLTNASGSAERYPAWSPDGRKAAWWTDRSGEYELAVTDLVTGEETIVTHLGAGFRYQPHWSPDGRSIAFIDQTMAIHVLDVRTQNDRIIDRQRFFMHGALEEFTVSWSPDSRWMAYARELEGRGQQIMLLDTRDVSLHPVTSGYYSDSRPVFDAEGKVLFFATNRSFEPVYSDLDNTWVYPNSTRLAMVTLQKDSLSLLSPRNDTVAVVARVVPTGKHSRGIQTGNLDPQEEGAAPAPVRIDLEGIERRVELLPVPAGNYGNLASAKGKFVYLRYPLAGSETRTATLAYWDFGSRQEETVAEGVDGFQLAERGERVLVQKEGQFFMTDLAADQKTEKPVPASDLPMTLEPSEEWRQIFDEVWRLQRDFFYDKDMHGLDWPAIHQRYSSWLPSCATRSDLNFVIGELIGELNASHTYRGGGDQPEPAQLGLGYLGLDWAVSGSHYAVGRILAGAPWDAEVRSPLAQPGIGIREGDLILAVNGRPLTVDRDPGAFFAGLADQSVELTVAAASAPSLKRKVVVRTLADERPLRNLDWIEQNRAYVDRISGGKVGYVYVPSTGIDGQNELVRQFSGQWHKAALLIDERWNSGGQIPDRFVELLNRKPLAYWAVRDGETWRWPPVAHFGPKAMLINGWSGSGGDAFPDFFRKSGLGPLVGARTWGGLIGISGCPQLVDNGFISVPTFRMYNPDGTWFREGHGVDPDIPVPEDPGAIARGTDPQVATAVNWLMEQLKQAPAPVPPRPPAESR